VGDHDARLDSVEQRGDTVVAAFSWSDSDGRRHTWAQVLKLRDGSIVDMQDYKSPRVATTSARLRALFA
jgi:hypothetical protein